MGGLEPDVITSAQKSVECFLVVILLEVARLGQELIVVNSRSEGAPANFIIVRPITLAS
jgi:hypothetical protein